MPKEQYGKDYFNVHMIGGYEAQENNPTFTKRIKEFKQLGYQSGTVLDLGCAYGYFMKHCEAAGYQTIGVDIAPMAIKKARKVTKSPLHQLIVGKEPLPVKNGTVDIVSLFNMLEHIENYPQALRECHRVLRKGGLLYIYVPTEPRWLTDDTHLNYFTTKTLAFVLEHFGFEIITMGEEGGKWRNLFGVVRLVMRRHTMFNFVPRSTGAFISCFARKV
jgi:SAM-dependent methyltransferase